MNPDTQETLDKLLKDWAASREAGESHNRRLANHILSAAHDHAEQLADDSAVDAFPLPDRPVPASIHAAPMSSADWSRQLMIGGGGLLLFLVLAGCLLWYNLTTTPIVNRQPERPIANSAGSTPPTTAATGDGPPRTALLGASVLAAKRQLLTETNAIFDNRVAWIADGEREMSLDILQEAASEDSEFMLIRVVVANRATPDSPWSTIWQTDVISRSEALVEIASNQLDGSSLALWTYLMSDGEVAVDMDLVLGQETQTHSFSSTVLHAGRPTRVGCSTEEGVEQCVFQTVMPLSSSKI